MQYSAWHSVIQDGNGAVVPLAKITVRNTETGALAKLYSARDGSAPKGNPFNADENGQVLFFVAGGAYTVKAEFGSQERTWPFVPVGTAAEYDIDSLALYLNSGVVYVQTFAQLGSYAPLTFPAAAVVLADPNASRNGYYTNSGTGWVFGRALQDTISRLFITGGTVNTPTTTVGAGINPSAPLVFYVDVTAPNTASVTLNVVGLGPGVVLNAAGNALSAGEWLGRVMLTRETDGRYRIMNDPASALAAALSATTAGQQKDAAIAANTAAQSAKSDAETARTQAQTARTDAQSARDAAITARNEANTAKTDAQAARDSAATSAVGAATSASNASGSATAAGNSASAASTSATTAGNSATAASGSAGTATTQADRAKTEADRAAAAAGGLTSAVTYTPQTLTEPQKTQARDNIGAQAVNASTVGAALATPTPSETIADGDRLSGLDPSGTGLKLFRFSVVKAWIQGWLTKGMVGLPNADNTSDANKPVSTAQAAAIALKVTKSGDTGLGGFSTVPEPLGSSSGRTFTVSRGLSNIKLINNNGAFTLQAPADIWATFAFIVWPHTGNGALTAVGFREVSGTFNPSKTNRFFISRFGTASYLEIRADA